MTAEELKELAQAHETQANYLRHEADDYEREGGYEAAVAQNRREAAWRQRRAERYYQWAYAASER